MSHRLQHYRVQFKRIIYPLLLIGIAGALCVMNYTPGTFLTGWDTLHPEFNFPLAFERMINGVWRSDQGLGAIAIQSHMADLPRVFLLWITSFVVPLDMLRYVTFFVSLIAGPLGAYTLTKRLIGKHIHHGSFAAFFAGLAYLCNLATVQHFAVPLEMFAVQYALLPWLWLWTVRILETPKGRHYGIFALLTLLAAPQAQTATLFYAYFATLIVFLTSYITIHRTHWKSYFTRSIYIILITLAIHAFWLLPNIYAVITQGNAVRTSTVNQLFSQEAFLKNQQYGTWKDVLILKNFLYNWRLIDPVSLTESDVLAPWLPQLNIPLVQAYLWLLPMLTIAGLLTAIKNKNYALLSFAPPLLLSYLVIANNQWPTSWFMELLRHRIPVLGEALRFPFTKFSIILLTTATPFIGYALQWFFEKITVSLVKGFFYILLIVLPLIAFQPAFKGYLINPAMRITIPSYYFNVFDWFNDQPHDGRVAILPIHSFWNWTNYRWGYQGAGFLQFGIPQPILDRDYDRWSTYNENYYWELTRALYAKDPIDIQAVLTKYDISYILLDTAVISRDNNRSLYVDEIRSLLAANPQFSVAKTFGTVTIYASKERIPQITSAIHLPVIGPAYTWNDNDIAYKQFGDYITTNQTLNEDIIYPFRTIFTKRTDTSLPGVIENDTTIQIQPNSEAQSTQSAAIDKTTQTVFSGDLSDPSLFRICGTPKTGEASYIYTDAGIRMTSINQSGCMTLPFPDANLSQGYLVSITHKHTSGMNLVFSVLNTTAKHIELQTQLPNSLEWKTTYMILPPLSSDNLGYTLFFSNMSIGNQETINDIKTVTIYTLPYQELVTQHIQRNTVAPTRVLMQSQAYQSGWIAYSIPKTASTFQQRFPFLFGTPLSTHVKINSWKNGWIIPENDADTTTYAIYYLPQIFIWTGFIIFLIAMGIIVYTHTHET